MRVGRERPRGEAALRAGGRGGPRALMGERRWCRQVRGLLRNQSMEVAHFGFEPRSDPQPAVFTRLPSRPAASRDLGGPLPLGLLSPAGVPHPLPPAHSVPYSKIHLSCGHSVHPTVEVLNPLVQFFFPSLDRAADIFCGHYLVRTWKKKTTGSRLQEGELIPSKSQEWGLAAKDASWCDGRPSLAGRARGSGNTALTVRLLHWDSGSFS